MEYVEKHITHKVMPNETVTLMPIGDAQVGVEAADLKRLKAHMEWGFHTKHAMFLGMGDYVDMASPSNRRTLKGAGLYDTVTEALNNKACNDIYDFLGVSMFTKGSWLGLLQGHHYMENVEDNKTSDMCLAEALDAPFLGDSALVRIIFDKHKKVAAPIDQIYFACNGRMLHHTKLLACTGSFLKGYLADSLSEGRAGGTYVEKGMMTPVSLGGIVIELGIAKEEYGDRLDINVSL
jgi:hypothetical protein